MKTQCNSNKIMLQIRAMILVHVLVLVKELLMWLFTSLKMFSTTTKLPMQTLS
jgi:hypothetical protein